ncbi:MAG: patatin-like phospholipase family protein [Flavitalea sp.]
MNEKLFHLGLCMAGSVSAGAYTAGVIDYLTEALENWELQRGRDDIPDHRVVIDLLGGSSGGGITAAITLFAMQDKLHPYRLVNNQPLSDGKNILWDAWVNLSDDDVFGEMLNGKDISKGYVPSAMNTDFIDAVAYKFRQYIAGLAKDRKGIPAYLCPESELFLTLFNITGIKYELHTKAATGASQFAFEHRDLAHFRWGDAVSNDGRMELSYNQPENIETLLMSAPATGAFPLGLKARLVKRKARYLWEHPFVNKGSFLKEQIHLNEKDGYYISLNADGGAVNNEPVEVMRDFMLSMRKKYYKDIPEESSATALTNSTVILIDPFPSSDMRMKIPDESSAHLKTFTPSLLNAMSSQLLFDAKKALDAYNKENYGLHLMAPSKDDMRPEYALACGSLRGFGGFLNKDFRIHDFFLGRKNCQSFLRKYFVANLDATGDDRVCIESVIKGYDHESSRQRFVRTDAKGRWAPIIPEVSIMGPDDITSDKGQLPEYHFDLLEADCLFGYRKQIGNRYRKLACNMLNIPFPWNTLISAGSWFTRKKITDKVVGFIASDFKDRKLMK